MRRIEKTTKKKYIGGQEYITYLYECPDCKHETWSLSKRLYQFCVSCKMKNKFIKMELAI